MFDGANWMTSDLMTTTDGVYEAVLAARRILSSWDDARVKRANRSLQRIAKLSGTHLGAMVVERWKTRHPVLACVTLSEIYAINILRAVAGGTDAGEKQAKKLRQWLSDHERQLAEQRLMSDRGNQQAARSRGGRETAKRQKPAVSAKHGEVMDMAITLLAAERKPHELAGIIARKTGYSATQVRRILDKANMR